ncbi:S8 family serine peptidase [Bacillus massiliglaciei]|uniref:S8 family serine peptidase n=1 Tax=Bacillus massiliglaciei TaxID=1816693 RepID=UPI000AA7AB65|nr:S8 family serine peptidase [Bacillus massiliglaciei]
MRQLTILLLILLFSFSIPLTSLASTAAPGPFLDRDNADSELMVKFRHPISDTRKQSILSSVHAKEIQSIGAINLSLVSISSDKNKNDMINILLSFPEVQRAELNNEVKPSYIPADSGFAKQWYAKKIGMETVWDTSKGNSSIKIALIDGGVQMSHPELKGSFIKPYNIITKKTTLPSNEHGTHVAGIIAASMNKSGTAGIVPEVKLMPINVFKDNEADIYTIIDAIEYASRSGADIINLSLTTEDYNEEFDQAIQRAYKKGIIIVAAAGNEHTSKLRYPAAFKNVIGVSATDQKDRAAPFSNYGSYIDLSAPGSDIYSTLPGNKYGFMSGTSMAAPMVSGISALILSKDPFLTPNEILKILKSSSIDLGPKGWDAHFGAGRLDASKVLAKTPDPISTITKSSSSLTANGKNKMSYSFQTENGVKLSVYIKNSKDQVIKKLVTNKSWDGGTYTVKWDGKKDDGSFAPTGTYKLRVKINNSRHSAYKGVSFGLKNEVTPEIKAAKKEYSFSPSVTKKLNIDLSLNTKAALSAAIYNNLGKEQKSLLVNKGFEGGSHSLVWDGKDSKGKIVKDGIYELKLQAADAAGRQSKQAAVRIALDTKAPSAVIKNAAASFKPKNKSASAKWTVSESVNANISIVQIKDGKQIKTLYTKKAFNKGSHTVTWNGKNSKGQTAASGNYQFQMELIDPAGNRKIVKGPKYKLVR